MWRQLTTLTVLIALAAVPRVGHAGSLDGSNHSYLLGNTAALLGGAAIAIGNHPGAAWYNPAGLAQLKNSSINVTASAFMLRLRNVKDLLVHEISTGERSSTDLDSVEFISVPSAIIAVWSIQPGLTLALGYYTPRSDYKSGDHGLSITQDDSDTGHMSFNDAIAESSKRVQHQLGPAMGWQAVDWLRVGASVHLVYDTSQDSYRALYHVQDAEGFEVTRLGSGNFSYRDALASYGVQAGLGLQMDLGAHVNLGFMLKSPIYSFHTSGDAIALEADANADEMMGRDGFYRRNNYEISESKWLELAPMQVSAGLTWHHSLGLVTLEGEFMPALQNLEYGIDSQAIWNIRAGAEFKITNAVSLGTGIFTDHTGQHEVSQMHDTQINFYGGTLGAKYDTVYELANKDKGSLVMSTVIGLRYAMGVGTYGTNHHNPEGIDWITEARDVTFHEFSLHLGSSVSF